MSPKQLAFVDALPSNAWDIVKAAVRIGYSESYANTQLPAIVRKDQRYCRAIAAKSAEISQKDEPRRERALRKLDTLIDNSDTADRDVIGAVQVQGRMCGWLSETIRHETTDRQAQLDTAARKQVAQLAALSLSTLSLCGDTPIRKRVTSNPIDNVVNGSDTDGDSIPDTQSTQHCDTDSDSIPDQESEEPVTGVA